MDTLYCISSEDELEQLSREADMPLENVLQACIEDRKLLKYMVNMANREGMHIEVSCEVTCIVIIRD